MRLQRLYILKTIQINLNKNIDLEKCNYSQYYSNQDPQLISSIFEDSKMPMINSKFKTFEEFKSSVKGYHKITKRISCIGKYEILGLTETLLECPYSIYNVK